MSKEIDFSEILKENGLSATAPRILILSVFSEKCEPLSIGEIHKKLKGKFSETTIYRSLNVFVEKNIVRRVDLGTDYAFYELNSGHHHHHIVCKKCGIVESVHQCFPRPVINKIVHSSKFFSKITNHSLEFFGVCKTCKKKNHD